jgi:hypothetical protein
MWTSRKVVWLMALATLLPLLFFGGEFAKLYWFGDDWDMLDGASRLGLWRWVPEPFLKESVIPVSKLFSIAAVRLFGGSYFAMIALLFATHAANVWLYGEILRRLQVPVIAIAFALGTFGLAWSNIETLLWFIQWTPVLAMTFFLAAWLWLIARDLRGPAGIAGYTLLLGASALSSSRGIVSGLAAAVFAWCTGRRCRLILAAIVPAAALIVVMRVVMAGRPGPRLWDSTLFALYHWLLNPLYLLLPIPHKTVDGSALVICGAIKVAAIAAAWLGWRDQRPLLAALLCFDLLTSASAGYARAGTGLAASVSSRYQYISLFCFGPFAGLVLARRRRALAVSVMIAWLVLLTWPWRRHAPQWANERGVEVRRALAAAADNEPLWPTQMTAGRARELIREYNLH